MNGAFLPYSYWINYGVHPNHREVFMKLISKLAAVAAVIGLSLGFGSVSAQAGSYVACGHPGSVHCPRPHVFQGHPRHYNGSRIGFEFRFGNAPYYDPYYRPRPIYRPVPVIRTVRFCSNDAAVYKARSLGVRNIRAYSYHDHILIKGSKRGHLVRLAFARQHGCPIINY
jgi:hypothetical protein